MRQSVDQQAFRLQRRINDKISAALAERPGFEWEHIAKNIADELTGDTGWEYQMITAIGAEPRVVITRYDPYRVMAGWLRQADKKSLP